MKLRSSRIIWTAGLLLVVFFVAFPVQSFSRTAKAPKTKSPHEVRAGQKTEAPAAAPTMQDALHCDAKAAVLMDALTGEVLYEQDARLRIPPASFVKVMTLYLVYDAIRAGQVKLDDLVTVSEKAWKRAWKTDSSKMFIRVGDRVKVDDLMKGVAIASGNDACVALAEQLAGSEETFVAKMNEKAKSLGLNDTQFRNPDGIPAEGQYVSAMDMAILSKRYMEDHPEALALHSTIAFEYNGITQGNRNTLLYKNIGVDGLKTGHIRESGYHLDATAKRDGQRMIAVVMGCEKAKQRALDAQKLLEYGFKNFSTVEAVKKDASFGPLKVRRGKVKEVMLMAQSDARVTVPKGKEKIVSAVPQLPSDVVAPIRKGQVLAKVLVQKDGKVVKEVSLIASSEVQKTLIPSLPVIAAIIVGLALIGLIVFWRLRQKKF